MVLDGPWRTTRRRASVAYDASMQSTRACVRRSFVGKRAGGVGTIVAHDGGHHARELGGVHGQQLRRHAVRAFLEAGEHDVVVAEARHERRLPPREPQHALEAPLRVHACVVQREQRALAAVAGHLLAVNGRRAAQSFVAPTRGHGRTQGDAVPAR